MTNIRRYYNKGNIYFTTHVTCERKPILVDNFPSLWQSIENTINRNKSNLIAWVIMPDHMHLMIDPHDNSLSDVIKTIKLSFSAKLRKKENKFRGRIWQYRFWDHVIRDESDFTKHLDYIHYNPVKHRIVENPFEYKYSSLNEYLETGLYENSWDVNGKDFGISEYGE